MSAILLPDPPDRESILGFWISIVLVGGALVAGAGLLVGVAPLAVAAVVAPAAAILLRLGFTRERLIDGVYRFWNRAAARYAQHARRMITRIWYHTVITTVARGGEGRRLDMEGSSWLTRETMPAAAYGDPGMAPGGESTGGFRDLARWATRSERSWALVLLPLLAVLRALDTRGRTAAATETYTLY
jgi:hypothetical protein